jgi:Transposase DDE domain
LSAGAIRPQPGSPRRPSADRLRAALHARGAADCDRGVRWQQGGSDHAEISDRQSEVPLRDHTRGVGRRSRHAARIRDDLKVSSLDWITCLRAPQIQALAREDGPLQLSLFDERDLAEITSPDFPGERLIVCRNRELAKERARKREALLVATERELARLQVQVRRKGSSLRTAAEIGLAVGEVVNAKKVAKHFALDIRDGHFSWARKVDQIAAEAKLDGIYVVRTSVPAEDLSTAHAVQAYKDLSRVERAFRSMKTNDLEIRPIRHWNADRVRAHVFLCMLAYHVEWHLRQALASLLFHETDLDAARAERSSPVVSTEPSPAAKSKKAIKRNANGEPVHSFGGLIDHLGTMTLNTMRMPLAKKQHFTLLSKSTPLQEAAFQLLGFDPKRVQ